VNIARAKPAGVLFDLDDTLYPERDFVRGGFRAVARFLGPRTSRPPSALAARLEALHERSGRGKLFDALLEELGMGGNDDLVRACVLVYRTHRPRLTPSPGVVDAITTLRGAGLRTGLVSDGLAGVQHRKLDALRAVARQLDVVVMTDELGPGLGKPSPVSFRVACRLLDLPPDNAFYVGNDPRKDFVGARAAGLRTIRTGRLPDEGGGMMVAVGGPDDADEVLDPFAEIVPAILRPSGSSDLRGEGDGRTRR
jgi:putative hydrolase of the HAD superfamily